MDPHQDGLYCEEELDLSNNSDDSGNENHGQRTLLREQDRFLPIANVAKIMKKALPDNGKIAKDARECVQECVSEFISFITSEASDRCHQEKRKTINGEDILYAMMQLGFDNYVEPLQFYLHKYRETTKTERSINTSDGNGDSSNQSQTPQHSMAGQFSTANGNLNNQTANRNNTFFYTTDSFQLN